MKKLIVVLIVLSMASAANAMGVLVLTISGPDSLVTGATGTYTVGYSGAQILAADVDIVVDYGTIGGGVILTTNNDRALDWLGINCVSGNYEVSIVNDISMTDLGSPLFSFQFTAPSAIPPSGYAHISLIENAFFDLNWNQITGPDLFLNGKTVTIPEPMTMGLLGLGTLFLRHRKR
ncbi:MAG: PEP-CTERM sorting domain-containing protein [Sedimentisphaerales bacterium]|jgi:hypothetical protein